MLIEKPKPVVNGKQICVEDTVDCHGIEKKFIEYCCNIISLWSYLAVLITVIFGCSGQFFSMTIIWLLILIGITIPIV